MINGYLKSLRIVHFALAAGIIIFMSVSVFLNVSIGAFMGKSIPVAEKTPYIIILIMLTGGVLMAYRIVIAKKLETIKAQGSLDNKLIAWREIVVLRGALLEGPAFFAIVIFMLLGIHVLLLWPIAAVLLFWFLQPTRERFMEEAALSADEIHQFNQNN